MLKCNEGIVECNSDVIEHTADLTILIYHVYAEIEAEYSKEIANVLLRKAFKDSMDLVEEVKNEFGAN